MRSGIGWTEIVDGINDSASHQVKPNAIGLGAGKQLVVRAGDPLGERFQRVVFNGDTPPSLAEKTWMRGLMRARVFDFSFARDVDNLLAFELMLVVAVLPSILQDFVLHPRKNAGPIEIIVLRPTVERVIVTLGALQARAQEELSGGLGPRHCVAAGPIKIGGGILISAAARAKNIAHELIDRFILSDALANPVIKCVASFTVQNAF